MARNKTPLQLGRTVAIPASPKEAVLDAVANPHPDTDYMVRFTAPEFTTLCPITGQPDFAHFVIDYCPAKSLVESKSLKLFLASFPQHGRIPRGLHRHHRQARRGGDQAQISAHRGLLVSARRHSHRRVLADGAVCRKTSGCPTSKSSPIADAAEPRAWRTPHGGGRSRDDRSPCRWPARRHRRSPARRI